jgi:hypothetical protein
MMLAVTIAGGIAMRDGPILYIDRSTIAADAIDDVRAKTTELVAFIESREPRLLCYGFVIDADAGEMTVAAVHPDTASLELHLQLGGPRFAAIGRHIRLRSIEVFGQPSPGATEALYQKARLLGNAEVRIRPLDPGFARSLTERV